MDQLSQALAAGFNAPVVYIQLLNGLLVAPAGVRAVRYFPLAVGTEGTNRWRSGEAMGAWPRFVSSGHRWCCRVLELEPSRGRG